MTRRASHHWHVVVDDDNHPTPGVIEHEHGVNVGRRHAHYHRFEEVRQAYLETGLGDAEARAKAIRLAETASTTLDLDREPRPSMDERAVVADLHPEVRRSLS